MPEPETAAPENASGRVVSFALRELREADLLQLVAIERQAFATPWDAAAFRAFLRRGHAFSRIGLAGEEVAGYALGWCVAREAELMNLAVAPRWRRLSLGSMLLRWVLATCAGRGASEVFLEVRASNISAQQLYLRHGFEEFGRRPGYYGNPREDALLFRARLGPG